MSTHRYTALTTTLVISLLAFTGCGSPSKSQDKPAEPTPTATSPKGDLTSARIISVEDADTITVERDGTTVVIDLMNVITPQTDHDNADMNCLAGEATDYLNRMLPPGSPVKLTYDDALGNGAQPSSTAPASTASPAKVTAGITLSGGKLVNAEMVRAGYGVATREDSTVHYNEVLQAQNEADQKQAGLYSRDIECTLPAQLDAATNNITTAQGLDLKEPLERAVQLTGTIAGYKDNPDMPLLAAIVGTQSVKTQMTGLTRAHNSKRTAYLAAEDAERERKEKEASASPSPSRSDKNKKTAPREHSHNWWDYWGLEESG